MMTLQELFDYACYLRHGTMPVAVAYDLWRVCIGRFNDIPLVQRAGVAEYVSERQVSTACRQCERADKRA